ELWLQMKADQRAGLLFGNRAGHERLVYLSYLQTDTRTTFPLRFNFDPLRKHEARKHSNAKFANRCERALEILRPVVALSYAREVIPHDGLVHPHSVVGDFNHTPIGVLRDPDDRLVRRRSPLDGLATRVLGVLQQLSYAVS